MSSEFIYLTRCGNRGVAIRKSEIKYVAEYLDDDFDGSIISLGTGGVYEVNESYEEIIRALEN